MGGKNATRIVATNQYDQYLEEQLLREILHLLYFYSACQFDRTTAQ